MQYHHGNLKSTILDTAEEVLAEKSLDAISMRELARKANVSPGAPYHHFGNRMGLVTALCQRGFSRLGDSLTQARDHGGIKSMTKAYLKFTQNHFALYQLMFSPEATENSVAELLHPYANPVFQILEEEIVRTRGTESGNQVSISIWCFMHGVASLSSASPLHAKLGSKDLSNFANETIWKLIQAD